MRNVFEWILAALALPFIMGLMAIMVIIETINNWRRKDD